MIKALFSWFRKDLIFASLILVIAIVAVFFRTYHYTQRISVVADNARDVQVARYAADHFKIPQIGQFSSAGPFFYGPWYYWFLALVSFLPFGPLTHWYVITSIYLLFILLIFWLAKEIENKWLGLLAALFAAISPAQINTSFSVWNPTIVPLVSLLTLIFLVRFFKSKKLLDLFFLSAIVGLGITIHFQSFMILPALPLALAVARMSKPKVPLLKAFPVVILGFLIPFLPLIYFDARYHWHNFASLFVYLTVDQYRIWVPNRWLTYLFDYWPNTWSLIIGGHRQVGYLLIAMLSLATLVKLKQFANNRVFYLLAATFCLEVIFYRYYRGERFFYYSFFAHPPVLVLSAWIAFQIWQFKKILGFIFISLIIAVTVRQSIKELKDSAVTLSQVNVFKQEIYSSFPDEKFDIYGCNINAAYISHPLALFMYFDARNEIGGVKIGVCEFNNKLTWQLVTERAVQTDQGFWFNKTTEEVYRHTVEWWKQDPPPSGGTLWQFIRKSLSPRCYPHC